MVFFIGPLTIKEEEMSTSLSKNIIMVICLGIGFLFSTTASVFSENSNTPSTSFAKAGWQYVQQSTMTFDSLSKSLYLQTIYSENVFSLIGFLDKNLFLEGTYIPFRNYQERILFQSNNIYTQKTDVSLHINFLQEQPYTYAAFNGQIGFGYLWANNDTSNIGGIIQIHNFVRYMPQVIRYKHPQHQAAFRVGGEIYISYRIMQVDFRIFGGLYAEGSGWMDFHENGRQDSALQMVTTQGIRLHLDHTGIEFGVGLNQYHESDSIRNEWSVSMKIPLYRLVNP
ncbi:hypothetical protein K8S19_08890 [bacterium]|nr:hypothetical protein [bacterium]